MIPGSCTIPYDSLHDTFVQCVLPVFCPIAEFSFPSFSFIFFLFKFKSALASSVNERWSEYLASRKKSSSHVSVVEGETCNNDNILVV